MITLYLPLLLSIAKVEAQIIKNHCFTTLVRRKTMGFQRAIVMDFFLPTAVDRFEAHISHTGFVAYQRGQLRY